jgi:hypothetical protein
MMDQEIPDPESSRIEPLSVVWHVLVAPETLLALMGLIALSLVLGTLIPQIPPRMSGDPQAWLAGQPSMLSPGNGLIRALGLFDLYRTFWFRMVLVLTGLVLFVWAVESADLAWQATRRTDWTAQTLTSWTRHAVRIHVPSDLPRPVAQSRLGDFLTLHGYRWDNVLDPPGIHWIAKRREIALWMWPLAYGALTLSLVGLAIVGSGGWQDEDWRPAPGEILPVGHGRPYAVRLDAFRLQFGKDGRPCDYRSDISWLENDQVVRKDVAGVGRPATFRGMAVRQIGYLPILEVQAWDTVGRPLTIQVTGLDPGSTSEMGQLFPSEQAQLQILVPPRDRFLTLTFEPTGIRGRPGFHVLLTQEGETETQTLGFLYESGSVAFDDVRVDVDLSYGPILRMDSRPAMSVVIGGMVIGLVSLGLGWTLPSMMWVALAQDGECATTVRIQAMPGTSAGRELARLASRLQRMLADET